MSNQIMDHFTINPPSFHEICDSSLDQHVVKARLREHYERTPIEAVYRTLYKYVFIKENAKWISYISEEPNEVYFVIDLGCLLKSNPGLKENLSSILNKDSAELWLKMCS